MSAATIKTAQLDEYAELKQEKQDLDRKSRAIETRLKMLETHFKNVLETKGKREHRQAGYIVQLVKGSATVKWKEAFLDVAGADKAAELTKVAARNAELPANLKVSVTPPAAA